MRIINEQGIPTKGAARFIYKGHTILLDTMGDAPEVKVTVYGITKTFKSMDHAIDSILTYRNEAPILNPPY